MSVKSRKELRARRHRRVRRKISGTAERPRLSVMISNRHMYVQFINDDLGATMASVSTAGTDVKVTVVTAKALGLQAAAAALSKGIGRVVVDRGGCKFHGRVKAIVDGAIEGGLSIGVMKEAT
jgi:large subunit ribosomal protein L18